MAAVVSAAHSDAGTTSIKRQLSSLLRMGLRIARIFSCDILLIVARNPLRVNCFLNFMVAEPRYRGSLSPTINELPPSQTHPFFDINFSPLAICPPLQAELTRVIHRSYAEFIRGECAPKNTKSATGMEIRGHDQHGMGT